MNIVDFATLSPADQISALLASLEEGQNDKVMSFCDLHETPQEICIGPALTDPQRLVGLAAGVCEGPLFAKFLKIIVRIDGLEQACYAGGHSKLLNGLDQYPNNNELAKTTFQIFSHLATDTHIRENLISADGIMGTSVKLLLRYREEPTTSIHILTALTNFFYRCTKNKMTFSTEGGLEILQSILRNPSDGPMALALSRIFHNLCNTKVEFRMQMSSFGINKSLVDLAATHIQDPFIIENLLWAFLNITLNSRAIKGDFNQVGGVPVVFQILTAHPTHPSITYHALALLNQISSRTTTRVAVAVQNAIVILLDLLWAWESHPAVQLMCLKVIDILCTLSSCRKRLAEGDRLPRLVTWLCEQMENRPIIEAGLGICQKLAISSGDSRRALQDSGGNTFFVNINTKYSHDQELTCQCVQSSSSLTEQADYENESSDEEVLSSGSSGEYDY